MTRRQPRWPTGMLFLVGVAAFLFLLLPMLAIFSVGLYYTLGIFLVADLGQMLAALGQEVDIVPALTRTPLVAIGVALLASAWGLGLSLLWRAWFAQQHGALILLSALPFLLPRFGLGALFLLACLKLAQWGGSALGLGLVALSQAAVAAPLVAAILCLGWKRVDPVWRLMALETGAGEGTIFRRLSWPVLRPYLAIGALLAFVLSLGDFYLGNALAGDTGLLPGVLFSGVAQNASPLYHSLLATILIIDMGLVLILTRQLRRLPFP